MLKCQLEYVHRLPQLLFEDLETAVQEQPFHLFVDRLASQVRLMNSIKTTYLQSENTLNILERL